MTKKHHLIVNIGQQKLFHYYGDELLTCYPISSSAKGVGNAQGSYQTPLGLHQIKEKIGDGCAEHEVFIGRQPQGDFFALQASEKKLPDDIISSRILWLDGLEKGINKGGNVDSYQRYIYIHGTMDEDKIGQPVSHGCIRMRNKDVIELYAQLDVGCKVLIEE